MRFPLELVKETLDHYAALGKELHITEFTPTSGSEDHRLIPRGRVG